MAFELKSIDSSASEIRILRAIAKNRLLVDALAKAPSDAEAEKIISENGQTVRNVLAGLDTSGVGDVSSMFSGDMGSSSTAAPAASAPVNGVDPAPILKEIADTIQMMSSSFTVETLKTYLSSHPDFNSKFEAELAKGYGFGLQFMRSNVATIATDCISF